jgi:hypothetical protein
VIGLAAVSLVPGCGGLVTDVRVLAISEFADVAERQNEANSAGEAGGVDGRGGLGWRAVVTDVRVFAISEFEGVAGAAKRSQLRSGGGGLVTDVQVFAILEFAGVAERQNEPNFCRAARSSVVSAVRDGMPGSRRG